MKIKCGSHLYGTSTPASDEDFKSVFIPDAADILLQRGKPVIQNNQTAKPKISGQRNEPGDVDNEAFALHRFLGLLSEGQTIALDMLFAPDWAFVGDVDPLWPEIRANRSRLISSRAASSFVGYCKTQANKFGVRGSRANAVRAIVGWFDEAIAKHGQNAKLFEAADTLEGFIADRKLDHTSIIEIHHREQINPVTHLECCNRKTPFFNSLKDCRAIYFRVLSEYGARALMAESNNGIDWKALSHAVRVGKEAIEFMNTGWITFPLVDAAHILAIKKGEIDYKLVAAEIDQLLAEVEAAHMSTSLPETSDQKFIEKLICDVYGDAVMKYLT